MQGPTHRLEIYPSHKERDLERTRREERGEREKALRMSDLERGQNIGERNQRAALESDGIEERLQSLQDEVDTLRTKVEEESFQNSLPLTSSRSQGYTPRDQLPPIPLMSSRLQGQAPISSLRADEELLSKMKEIKKKTSSVSKCAEKLQASVKKLHTGGSVSEVQYVAHYSTMYRPELRTKVHVYACSSPI